MNLSKLREAESLFLHRYPGGFDNDEIRQIGKRHNVGKLSEFATSALTKKAFNNQAQVLEDIVKIVTRSSMVSMFEKPKFRDFVNGATRNDRSLIATGFKRLLHGKRAQGFDDLVDIFGEVKLAKWSLMTICSYQYRPDEDVFVKPTTTKNVIRQFQLTDLVYNARPSWAFYARYRDAIAVMKAAVSPSLSPSNAAFTGFLMMTTSVGQHR